MLQQSLIIKIPRENNMTDTAKPKDSFVRAGRVAHGAGAVKTDAPCLDTSTARAIVEAGASHMKPDTALLGLRSLNPGR